MDASDVEIPEEPEELVAARKKLAAYSARENEEEPPELTQQRHDLAKEGKPIENVTWKKDEDDHSAVAPAVEPEEAKEEKENSAPNVVAPPPQPQKAPQKATKPEIAKPKEPPQQQQQQHDASKPKLPPRKKKNEEELVQERPQWDREVDMVIRGQQAMDVVYYEDGDDEEDEEMESIKELQRGGRKGSVQSHPLTFGEDEDVDFDEMD